jgi:hypothetical protein
MGKDIHYYEILIQEKAKNTSFRDFIKHIAGWCPVNLYKRNHDISVYPETARSPRAMSPKKFAEQAETLTEYGIICNTSLSFFENYQKIFYTVPFSSLRQFPIISNSDYTDSSGWGTHNCYLDFGLYDVEGVLYSFEVKENCKNIFNSVMVWNNCENVYQSNCIVRSSSIFYSRYILESHDIWFSTNLVWCNDCIYCDNLRNASYSVKNKQYTKEQYEAIKKKMLQDQKWFEKYYTWLPVDGANLVSKNTTGNYITNSRNVENGHYSYNITNGKNILLVGSIEGNSHIYNVISSGSPFFDHGYNVMNSGWGNHMYCSDFVVGSNLYYCYFIENCHHCLGCIWLKNKSYCIFNKQYTKEEWEEKACEIFASMEADGTLWEFFPASMNPFYFNDTLAYLIDDSFTKEEVEKDGYLWRDEPIKVDIPVGMKVVKNTELDEFQGFINPPSEVGIQGGSVSGIGEQNPQSRRTSSTAPLQKELTWYIDPEILNVVISDEKWNYYRIVKMEYDFLMKHGLPLPTQHWLDRIKMGFR